MAELRRVCYPNGNSVEISSTSNNGESQRHIGYKSASYDLKTETIVQPKSLKDDEVPAVVVRAACKHYTKGVPVLQNLNMTVKRGAIYSLLGSSGCGKTTALNTVVGVRKLNSGNVYVFGAKPGVKGKQVGFMPQETSLYGDFTIAETLSYFGMLCGMDKDLAAKGVKFLTQLLRLPESSRRVGTLSGGQRRRVSLAVALIHSPDLLVLDECFVGLDVLIREEIWSHLLSLVKDRGTTILITTHYIDEAKYSTMVGVMRFGRLLVEQDPNMLLQNFNSSSLEDVILILCKNDKTENDEKRIDEPKDTGDIKMEPVCRDAEGTLQFIPPIEDEDKSAKLSDSFKRIKSLIHKNLVILFRNLLLFFFSVIMPASIILVMCIAFKDDPKNLDFGVVNYEVPNLAECLNIPPRPPNECDIENLSCRYLQHIPDDIVDLVGYQTEEDAAAAVHRGSVWGYMVFPKEYSTSFYERSSSSSNIDNEVFNNSEIIVRMDQTSKNIVNKVKKSFNDGFELYAMSILKGCGFDERQAEFTLDFKTPVFGSDDTKFIEFIAPSVTVAWLYFFPIIAASIRYITEKKQGTYERSLVAGTKTWEILFAYGSTECIVLVLQSCLVYFILNVAVGVSILGSIGLVMLLFLMCGFGGVSMGLFIGSLCNEEIEAALLAMALFFPNVFVSGLIWPMEGMPVALQYISYALPCTLTGEAMRSIFSRGWTFTHPNVWPGFLSLLVYIVLYFVLTVLVQTFRRK